MIHRRGLTLVEVVAAAAILAAVLGAVAQCCVSLVGHQIQQRTADLALREARHAMLLAEHLPFSVLSADTIEAGCDELGVSARLHDHDMVLHVAIEEGVPLSRDTSPSPIVSLIHRKVTAVVSWRDRGQARQVQRVTWRCANRSAGSPEVQQP
ncbi:MAG: prepilin-type N-terminal cleavage/methylation domain-containing protein [Planctomycetota bacterium]|nr:prepilin-type N-terminal cleavage/methylation domain-containing protein [Planctomycetota bacterium]MDA1180472.1 prepilin-type N-terminal cleavage/methylation domain-containing protein [Planctomycetota bacterium]